MIRTVTAKAKGAIADAAQRSAKGVKSIAGEALGAAAKAAAQVVLDSTANALEAGRARIRRSTPAMKQAAGKAATAVSRPARRKMVAKKGKTTARHKRKTGRRSRR